MDKVALVTGAARGLGLELCRQLVGGNYRVIACPRSSGSAELADLIRQHPDRLFEVPMDVADDESVDVAAREIARKVEWIDLLINNAGLYPDQRGGLESLETDELIAGFQVNSIGPLRVTRALLPLLLEGRDKRLVQMTSLMGSIADNSSGGSYAYRMSKAALNMANRNLAHELGGKGFIAIAMHPGWVQTRMGGHSAPMTIAASVESILDTVRNAGPGDNGTFKRSDGQTLPF